MGQSLNEMEKVRLIRSEYNDAIRGMASVRLRIPFEYNII